MNSAALKKVQHQLECLLRAHLEEQRNALLAVVNRVYDDRTASPSRVSKDGRNRPVRAPRRGEKKRRYRGPAEIAAVVERLAAAVLAEPGVGIARLAAQLGATARDLEHPMALLKEEGRVRSVGRSPNVRYFPLTA